MAGAGVGHQFPDALGSAVAQIVEDLGTVVASQRLEVRVAGDDPEYLLFDWLKTLLYHFDAEHLLFSRFDVQVGAEGLAGTAWGEPLDRERHVLDHEVKAITYHGLTVEPIADGWRAEVIVDI